MATAAPPRSATPPAATICWSSDLTTASAIPATSDISRWWFLHPRNRIRQLHARLDRRRRDCPSPATAATASAAFDGDRIVNLGGSGATVTWGTGAGQANFGQLVLGATTSNAMVDFVNPLNLGTTQPKHSLLQWHRSRSTAESAATSAAIGQITKLNDGVLSFAGNNSYSSGTRIEEGMLRLDSPGALPTTGNVIIGQGATLGIGADTAPGDPNADFARTLGNRQWPDSN